MWINTGVNARQREGFMDIKQRKLQLLPLNLNRLHMQDGEGPILEFWKKQRDDLL